MTLNPGSVEALAAGPADTLAATHSASLRRDTLRNIVRQRSALIGLTILIALFLIAIFAPFIAPTNPDTSMLDLGEAGKRGASPCIHLLGCAASTPQHLMGLDSNLRDEFSRVIFGARVSLPMGFLTVGFSIVIGTLIGAVAGFAGGWLDNLLMRIMDIVLSFPSLILAIAIVTVLGPGLFNSLLAIGIVSIPVYARVMRASVLSVREADFVTASRALGESSGGLLARRVLPNALTPLIVQGTLGIASAILSAAALSFLGLGAEFPTPEWGLMLGEERNSVFNAPFLVFFPGFAIMITVLPFNLIGDGLRDVLDPRLVHGG